MQKNKAIKSNMKDKNTGDKIEKARNLKKNDQFNVNSFDEEENISDGLYEDNSNLPYSDNEEEYPKGIKHASYDNKIELNQVKLKKLKNTKKKPKNK